ncbi:hypothetical protein OC846_005918 [Tilletia horrida]|uniref:Uncharacterized protein n=1 Tax=Tilletia horrida TaxID=155126 RepID=A0AAN6JR73_9BASI|nr:hypothetical protein OC845_005725 [Tilletia horrida]KAK0544824.1 hypothetical protein OC846_005918 [Tilletia horrida]KAK0560966.1 hypothetical protein OC861_006050 [Tilletia horrida]
MAARRAAAAPAAADGPSSLRPSAQSDQEQLRNHRVSLLSLHPSPAPSTRSPSPDGIRTRSAQPINNGYDDDEEDISDEVLDPPTLRSYRKALRYHLLALLPALGLILILTWVSSSYADLSRDHRHHKHGSRPSQKPALILSLLGASAWLAAYAVRPLVWDLVDNVLRIISLPFSWISQKWAARRASKRQYQQPGFAGNSEWEQDEHPHAPPSSPLRTAVALAFSILLRTVVLELLRVGSMALGIAVLQAATRRGHIWLQEAGAADFHGRALRLSPYDVRFGAVLWTTVGWCTAEWLVGSYDVIRKLGLYHPSLWPEAIYSASAFQDEQDEDRSDTADAASSQDEDDADAVDQEAAFPRSRTQNSRLTRVNEPGFGPGSSGIEAATSAAQAAVHAVRFFPRVFTQASAKSSSSSAFTVRPPGQGGAGTSGFGLYSAAGPQQSVTRRRAGADFPNSTRENEQQNLLVPAGSTRHGPSETDADAESRMYGTFQTARTSPPTIHLRDEVSNRFAPPATAAYGASGGTNPRTRDFAYENPVSIDPEEEAALQADLAHALAILLAARERADLEDTLGARLDTQVGPALAALWRIDGFVWNLGECLIAAAAVALASAGPPDEDWEYETFPGLTETPLWPTWLILTAIHTLLSLLWATALPRLGFAPVSYSSLLLGLGLTVAGLAWWGVLI